LREEAFEWRLTSKKNALSEAQADPGAGVVKSVDVDDVARDADATGEFVSRGFGEVCE
jgi:hypothetical protein